MRRLLPEKLSNLFHFIFINKNGVNVNSAKVVNFLSFSCIVCEQRARRIKPVSASSPLQRLSRNDVLKN